MMHDLPDPSKQRLREFLRAAELGTRLKVRERLDQGQTVELIQRAIVREYRDILAEEAPTALARRILIRVRKTIRHEVGTWTPPVRAPRDVRCAGQVFHAVASLN